MPKILEPSFYNKWYINIKSYHFMEKTFAGS